MILADVLKGLQLSPYTQVAVIDAMSDKYLKGGYVKDVIERYSTLNVVRTVISSDGIMRFWVTD